MLGDDPFALEEIEARLPPGENAARAALDGGAARPAGEAARRSRVAAARAAAHRPADVLDGLARRSGRHGAPRREGGDALPAPEAEARRRRRARRRARARGPRASPSCRCRSTSTSGGRSTRRSTRCRSWRELGVAYCEQPLRPATRAGRTLKRRSPIPIYVDEDCHTLADVAACAEIAHGINIKLAKSGGIREAIRMAHAARALGLGVMLGCMIESGLGIAAGCVVAPLCDHVDLDGNLLIADDPWPGVALHRRRPGALGGAGARCRASLSSCWSSPRASPATRTTARRRAASLALRRRHVVAILDSTRAGETQDGVPIVGDGERRALLRADDGARRRRDRRAAASRRRGASS